MNKKKHIIWDWNGTLFDDTWLCLDIMNKQLEKIGKNPISYDEYQRLFDFPVKKFYEDIGFDFKEEPYESVAQNFIKEYTKRRFECSIHNGVPAVLEKFNIYCSQSILSAYSEDVLIEMVEHFNLSRFFIHIVGLDNHYAAGKIEEGKALLEKLNLPDTETVLIGDTRHDYEVAEALGIDSILVCNGHQNEMKLLKCNVPVVKSLSEAMWYIVR